LLLNKNANIFFGYLLQFSNKNMIKKADKKQENPLISFMKKHAKNSNKEASKDFKNFAQKYGQDISKNTLEFDDDENLSKEEKLKKAKQESNAKAAQRSKTIMVARLFTKTIMRYILIITLLTCFAILLIKAAPLVVKFFHGLISRIFFSAFS
jgi:hypothetical protein